MKLPLMLALCLAAPTMRAAAQESPAVTVERIAPGNWRATYRTQTPVVALRFSRPAGFYRERVWKIVTPGYHFTREGEWQFISIDSGAVPAKTVAVEFPEFTDALPKEYELFQPFTDGAVAIYTGHFHAVSRGTSPGDSALINRMRIQTPPGAHAIVQARLREGLVSFVDSLEDGTYVYLGRAQPIETPDIVAIVDPGLPSWLISIFNRNLPALFHEYARLLGASLPVKPVVYFSYEARGSGRSSGGGTLTGLMSMVISGDGWRAETPAAAEQAFWLIAHESAHMWNGQLARNADDGSGSWMHEGSADAMAMELLRSFGVIDSSRYRARRDEAFNKCIASVVGGSVETALQRGNTASVYNCGVVMSVWTDAIVRRTNPDAGLFTFWKSLIARSSATGSYDADSYYALLRQFGASAAVVERMRAFLSSRDSAAIAIAGLQQAGISVTKAAVEPAAYGPGLARNAMVHVMQQACGKVSFEWGNPVRTAAMPGCAPFANPLAVYGMEGKRMRDQGVELYDAVRTACASGEQVTLNDNNGAALITAPCTKRLTPRIPWLELGAGPPRNH